MTDYEGKKGFLILLEETENDGKVLKQSLETSLESRLTALESKIQELKDYILQNNKLIEAKKLKNNGFGAIRTPDLRREWAEIRDWTISSVRVGT